MSRFRDHGIESTPTHEDEVSFHNVNGIYPAARTWRHFLMSPTYKMISMGHGSPCFGRLAWVNTTTRPVSIRFSWMLMAECLVRWPPLWVVKGDSETGKSWIRNHAPTHETIRPWFSFALLQVHRNMSPRPHVYISIWYEHTNNSRCIMRDILPSNSLGPSDVIWRQRSGSTLGQVMAYCLTAPSHYLNQCWLIISKVGWLSFEGKFTRAASAINHWNYLEN